MTISALPPSVKFLSGGRKAGIPQGLSPPNNGGRRRCAYLQMELGGFGARQGK